VGFALQVVRVTETSEHYEVEVRTRERGPLKLTAGHLLRDGHNTEDSRTYWQLLTSPRERGDDLFALFLKYYTGHNRAPILNEIIEQVTEGMDKKTPADERAEQMSTIAGHVQSQKEFDFFAYVVIKAPGGGVLHVNRSLPKRMGRRIFSMLVALELAGPEFGSELDLEGLTIDDDAEDPKDDGAEDI